MVLQENGLEFHLGSNLGDVFIAAPGEVHNDDFVLTHAGSAVDDGSNCMRGFKRGNDAFEPGQLHESIEGLLVGCVAVFNAILVAEPGMFGADGCIVESGRNAVSGLNLPMLILKNVGASALKHAE